MKKNRYRQPPSHKLTMDKPQKQTRIEPREITTELQESYLDYAMSVIVSRALPDIRDGLKPVQRRILWAMWEDNLTHSAKFRKSANVVGSVLGRYHPHGDAAVYDALARMAQDFSLRYPLIDGQGNWGCFTGDTKVKLTDGRSLSFRELVKEHEEGKRNYTYTFNHFTGRIEVAEIQNPRLTRSKAELVKVVLDNDKEVKCTPDHRFMLRDGCYKEAKDLRAGDSLMPGYIRFFPPKDRVNAVGYTMIKQPVTGVWDCWAYCLSEEKINEKIPKLENALKYFGSFNEIEAEAKTYNHTVKGVKGLKSREDVYDLTIDGYHNFLLDAGVFVHNSIDGDSPAQMRYTEARLSKIAEELLKDIEKETVDWQPNYDNSRKEPKYLPAKLPNLLVNGTVGIAVGMATSIPPHNLGEVVDALVYLNSHADAGVKDLMKFIPGPDFPTGGVIYNSRSIEEAYARGRGSVTIRAVSEVEEKKGGGFQIVITEIPYQVNKSSLIEAIAKLHEDKRIEGIRDIRDESDRGGLRIVIDLKSGSSPQKILNQLFKYSELQKNFYFNMLALVGGIQPETLSLKDVLGHYLTHRRLVVRRRTEFDLKKAEERAHILEGLSKALTFIDKIIATIKKSKDREEAKQNLTRNFRLTAIQADAILEMKLSALAALERKKIDEELKEKRRLIAELKLILKNPKKIIDIIDKELLELKKNFPESRRTRIVAGGLKEFREEDLVPEEEVIITLTQGGYVKRMMPTSFRAQGRGGKGLIGFELKEEDTLSHLLRANSHDNLLFFTDRGKVYQTKVYEIPATTRTAKGKSIYNFLQIPTNEKINALLAYQPAQTQDGKFLVMATSKGLIKKTALQEFENVRRTGIIALTLKGDDTLRSAELSSGKDELILTTALGQAIRFKEQEVRPTSRTTSGVQAIRLKKGDAVIGLGIIKESQKSNIKNQRLLAVTEKGFAKQTPLKDYKLQRRGGGGIRTAKIGDKTGPVIAASVLTGEEEEILVFSSKGQALRTKISNIRTAGRSTQGVKIMKLKADDKLIGLVCL